MHPEIDDALVGLIPAGAGNIVLFRLPSIGIGAHPRGCGEHQYSEYPRGRTLGSSPRVRGTYSLFDRETVRAGLIPAGAGNMSSPQGMEVVRGAHPRGCGEHWRVTTYASVPLGSSPRVRGTFSPVEGCTHFEGLIPAGAGNICCMSEHGGRTGAHPRGCGEHHSRRAVPS